MQLWISKSLPKAEMARMEFLVGEFTSLQTLHPADGQPPVQYRSVLQAYREGCDRFLRMEQFADVPSIGLVSCTTLLSYNSRERRYESYGFSSAYEQPLVMHGNWLNGELTMVSKPVSGYGGLARLRQTYKPVGEDRWEMLEERWDLCGFVKHVQGTYLLCPI